MSRILLRFENDGGTVHLVHVKGTETSLRKREIHFVRDGDEYNLTVLSQLYGGIERIGSASLFKSFTVTGMASGYVTGSIPTAVSWTGPSLLRFYASAATAGTPKQFLGDPLLVDVRALSSNFVP